MNKIDESQIEQFAITSLNPRAGDNNKLHELAECKNESLLPKCPWRFGFAQRSGQNFALRVAALV